MKEKVSEGVRVKSEGVKELVKKVRGGVKGKK